MCKICADLAKGSMNIRDAKRALEETRNDMDEEHVKEVEITIAFEEASEDPEISGFLDEYSEMMKAPIHAGPRKHTIPDDDHGNGDLD